MYLAHINDDGHREQLEKHLADVADRAAEFASPFDATEWGRLLGSWHDLGKYSLEFQNYIKAASDDSGTLMRGKVDHSSAGGQHATSFFSQPVIARVLAYCIMGHHAGLPDAKDVQSGGKSGLEDRLKKEIPSYDSAPRELLDQPCPPYPRWIDGRQAVGPPFQLSVFCRMLFSCLVDADFLATEAFMNPKRAAARDRNAPSPAQLRDVLGAHLSSMEATSKPSDVNIKRRETLAACRQAAMQPPGLFSLTVPTGGGKTLSSLSFALTHAAQHGLQRVIYAIPFTSIIEQNAKVFRDALRAAGDDVVLEHHCNFDHKSSRMNATDDEEFHPDLQASENWDAPVVVTTNVQLFESLFANKPSRCRKLHRIVGSVIVLDEVQTLPVELLRPTLAMLDELCRNYRCTVVLCSATQPAVERRDDFPIGLSNVREIVADAPALFAALKRVDIERIGRIDDEPLADRLAGHDQVLCVVNTRDHAGDLFRLLKDKAGNGVFHLSASMCARHRSAVLRLIRRKLECGDACRVVSTQLVEAGVDVDFPAVYRAMSGIDSIAQAAGRCNREGRLDRGHVYVFDTDVDPRGDLRLRRDKGLETASLHEDLLGLDAIDRYFTLLYWSRNDEWDKHEIMKCFSYSKDGLHAQFRQAAEKYRLIRDEQQPVIVPYGREGNRLIDELRAMRDPPTRSFARRAQRYTVGVHPWRLRRLIDNAAITLYHERFWVLEDSRGYDPDLGLGGDSDGPDPERFLC